MAMRKTKVKPAKAVGRPRGRPPGSTKPIDLDPRPFLQEMPHLASVQWVEIQCPYCGEAFETRIDPSQEFASYVEDCQVCCKPIQLDIESEEGEFSVSASRS